MHPHRRRLLLVALCGLLALPLQAQGLKLNENLTQLEAAARRDSNDAAAQYNVALGYWSKKRWDQADRALRIAVTIEPAFAQAWLALGLLPYARRPALLHEEPERKVPPDWRTPLLDAERARRRAFLVDPLVDLKILGAIVPVHRGPEFHFDSRSGNVFFVAENPFTEFQDGRYEDAFRVFDGWLAPYRRRANARRDTTQPPVLRGTGARLDTVPQGLLWFHGLTAAHLGRYDDALWDFETLLERDTTAAATQEWASLHTNDYRYLIALMYQREARWPDAIAMYHEALGGDLGLYIAHVQLSKIYETRELYDSAVDESRAAVLTSPEDPSLLLQHGVLLTEAGYLSAAEDTLWRAMNANPRDSRVPYFLGITEQAMHQVAEARAAFERFLALAPSRYTKHIEDARARLETLR